MNETAQGYAAAPQHGLREATCDMIVTVEPDGTFMACDIEELPICGEDFKVVFGTRTSGALIWSGAYMGFAIRMGNWAVAKLLEHRFNGPSLTNVGGTCELPCRGAYERLKEHLTGKGPHFRVELMIRTLPAGLRTVVISQNYRQRVGTSRITEAIKLGPRMIVLIIGQRSR